MANRREQFFWKTKDERRAWDIDEATRTRSRTP